MMPWLKVGLVSLAGALLEVMWGVGYHGFWKKDFDPESIFFSAAKIAGAPFVTLAALGSAQLVLPTELEFFVPTAPLTPFAVAVAFLLGYHSSDLLDLVHAKVTKLLGKTPGPIVSRPLPKSRVYPLDALVDHPLVASALRADLPAAVKALRAHGVHTTSDLMALKDRQLDEIARDHVLKKATLTELRALSESLARNPTLETGVAHFRRHAEAAREKATKEARDALEGAKGAVNVQVKGPL